LSCPEQGQYLALDVHGERECAVAEILAQDTIEGTFDPND